ncbi:MAG: rod shape-determining protein [Lachnospiraceae bacterium]|nr:rod shape-determining protein [Lachnospiraceae bacterium]
MNSFAFGIDLGTSNIRIYNRSDDSVIMEKNVIAIENKKTVFAYGDSAFEMYEKAPGNINITYPLTNGVIADIKNMEIIVKFFIAGLMGNNIRPADYFIAVPTDVTEVEKRAFYDLIKESNLKARKIMIIEKAIADGLGIDIDIKNSQGALIVDVGYDTTEISILSLGGIVLSRLIKTGGLRFDEAIKSAVRKEYSLFIGGKTSENVKISLKELEATEKNAVVYGRDIVTGLPVEREISTSILNLSLEEHFDNIIDNIKFILERTPPELSADIYKKGLYLTGGGSMVNRLAEKIANGTGLKVNLANEPQLSVVRGISKVINDENYRSVAYSIEGMGK